MALPRLLSRPVRRRGTVAATLLAALALALAGCAGDGTRPSSADATGPAGGRSQATEEPREQDGGGSASPTSSPGEEASEGTTVPLYFAGDGPRGGALFREFQRVDGDPLTEAARIIAGSGAPDDPDYRTLWPAMEISSVRATDGVLLVEIPGDGFTERPDGMSERSAELALQQLVYTLQGVQQERVPVQVQRVDGAPLFGLPTTTPYEAADPLETLNLVSITSPEQGATVTGDTLTVTGVASSFEASGPCRLLRGDEELALVGYQADGWLDRLYPFEAQLPLDGVTGEVTLQCETDDPSGGAEGSGPAIDTRTITVG